MWLEFFSLHIFLILSMLFMFQVTEHYKLCLYKHGRLQAIVPPGDLNTNPDTGNIIDEMGHRFVYKCKVTDCERFVFN